MERNPFSPPQAAVELPPTIDPASQRVLARFSNVLEAQVLKDLLVAEGIPASLGDAHTVQSNGLWTNALGGVRVMVPAAFVERSRELMAEVQAGKLELEGDADPALPAPVVATDRALWNVDLAALFSTLLTPVFGSVLMWLNERTLADARGTQRAAVWLGLSVATVGLALWKVATDGSEPSPWLGLRASILAWPYTLSWYVLAAHGQSRRIAKAHGRQYVHRSVWRAAAIAVLVLAAIGGGSMAL